MAECSPSMHDVQSSTPSPGGITKEGLSFLSSDRISSVHCSSISIMLWHMDTRSSKPCSYLLSHLLLVFNDSLAIPTASFFFLFSTYSIIAGWAGFSRQLPLLFLLLWEFKVLWLGQSVIGQMRPPVMVLVHLSDLLSQILHVTECGTCFPPWLHSLS